MDACGKDLSLASCRARDATVHSTVQTHDCHQKLQPHIPLEHSCCSICSMLLLRTSSISTAQGIKNDT